MHWLESHVWLATWLGLVVTAISLFVHNVRIGFKEIDWTRSLFYVAFVTALAVTFTPTFDSHARDVAGSLTAMGFGYILVDMNRRK